MSDNKEKATTLIDYLVDAATASLKKTIFPTKEAVLKTLQWFREKLRHPQEEAVANFIRNSMGMLPAMTNLPQPFSDSLHKVLYPQSQNWLEILNHMGGEIALAPFRVMADATLHPWKREYLQSNPAYVMPWELAVRYASGDPREYETALARIMEEGYNTADAQAMFELMRVYPDINTLRYELLTKKITEIRAREELNWQGYNDLDALSWLESITDVLSLNHIIAGAYREYLTPDAARFFAAKLGYDAKTLDDIIQLSRPTLPASDAVRAYWRGTLSAKDANWHIKASGYPLELAQTIEELTRPRAAPDDLVTNLFRGKISLAEVETELLRRGYTTNDIGAMIYARYPTLDPSTIKSAAMRGIITWTDHDYLLGQYGYNWTQIDIIKKLYQLIPSVNDLVTMAEKRAWDDDIARVFGYDEEFPEQVKDWSAKLGVSEEWIHRYWRAHWQLPPLDMAVEMLHRGVIEKPMLELLLLLNGWPAYWRDKVKDIAYITFERREIPEMYVRGVLTKEEVFKAYKDIGFDDVRASKITNYVVNYKGLEERDLSTSDLVAAYKDKIIKRDVLINNLVLSGYDENEAELIASKADYDINKEWRKGILDSLKTRFLNNDLTLDQINTLMHSYNFTADEISYYTALWQLEYSTKFSKLSVNDLFELYRNAIINKDQLDQELRRLGYNAQHRAWLEQLADTQRKVFQ